MLGSLRARLIISFALVVGLAVFLAGAGALFLLRDQQQETARERYGRVVEPMNLRVAALEQSGASLNDIRAYLREQADQAQMRILLLDQDLAVVFDSDASAGLFGKYILSFEKLSSRQIVDTPDTHYRWANYNGNGAHVTLFKAPSRPETSGSSFAPVGYEALIAIPQSQLASAWLDLVPRLALAGAIALSVSFVVSYFISRSISGPLARITQASKQMARGDYDVHIPIRGQDEVGRLSEAFNHMATQVNSSQRMMKDLLANVSHELKTPLTSIQGYSQAMVDGAVTREEDFQDSGRIIYEEATRMRALVDDLLLLSQIESGQVAMQHAYVDLAALLERMLERFQWALREGGIESGLHAGALALVHGDERRLEQVFSNLIENAVRHTPRGGFVNVTAAAMSDGGVEVTVHNTGSVIPAEDLPRVFERFFQVDRARARKGGSSGLGLAIVSEIVDAHGGAVRAESDDERGTSFIVRLPSAAKAAGRGRGRTREGADAKRAARKPAPPEQPLPDARA